MDFKHYQVYVMASKSLPLMTILRFKDSNTLFKGERILAHITSYPSLLYRVERASNLCSTEWTDSSLEDCPLFVIFFMVRG